MFYYNSLIASTDVFMLFSKNQNISKIYDNNICVKEGIIPAV